MTLSSMQVFIFVPGPSDGTFFKMTSPKPFLRKKYGSANNQLPVKCCPQATLGPFIRGKIKRVLHKTRLK